ncbi:related to hexose transporter protein [Hanseniaspora guilliermondii]|uniref:Related to hexose transporter protein n=1 Tax=Hanseniaspora guilliermondii TaxID=56406 RepID=A0A1L0B0Z9_9ASCO|nr:related to hexose transporter protein [Hanseniaspora guilliermondii]
MSFNNNDSSESTSDAVEKFPKNVDQQNKDSSQDFNMKDEEDINIYTVLPVHDKKWYKLRHFQKLMWIIFIISLTSCNTGFDSSLLNSLYTEKDFMNAIGNVKGSILGALTSGYFFGCFLSFFFSAKFNDKFGRKKCLIYCNAVMILGVLIQSVSGAWKTDGYPENYKKRDVLGMMIAGRVVIGIGSGVIQSSAPALIAELAYPEPTARSVQINYYNSSWYLGAVTAAWISFGVRNAPHHWSWRIPSICQCLFSFVQLILVPLCVPESPRWYVSKGRYEEARAVLNDLHAGNMENGQELVEYEMTEIQLAIEQENIASQTKFTDLFKTSANLKRMWIICWIGIFMQLSGNGILSYYLGKVLNSIGYTSSSQQLIINAGLMIYNLGCSVIQSFWIISLVKKRVLLIKSSIAGMFVSLLIWTILSARAEETDFKNKAMGKTVLAFIFIYFFFYNLGLNGLPFTYVTEILPYTIRAKGISVLMVVQFTLHIFNGFVNSIAMDAIQWKYYIVYVCILFVEFFVCFTFIETSGRTLEEVADLFGDGIKGLGAVSGIAALTEGKKYQNDEFVESL